MNQPSGDKDEHDDLKLCPECPDGNEWNAGGPTGRMCQVCQGHAVVHMDGSPLTKEEANAHA